MRKNIVLALMILSFGATAQLGLTDSDTTSAPPAGLTKISQRGNKLFFRNATGKKEVVSTNNSYPNPTWIPSLALSKITGLQDILSATQTALDLKANIASPTFTGTATIPTIENTLGANFATSSGNVGIGITAPTTKLQVQGNFYGSGTVDTGTSFGAYNVNQFLFNPAYSGSIPMIQVVNSAPLGFATTNTERGRFTANGNLLIGTTTDSGYKTDVNGTIRITNDAYFATTSGNVGIGNTSPAFKLDVTGTSRFTDNITIVNDKYIGTNNTTGVQIGGGNVLIGGSQGVKIGNTLPNTNSSNYLYVATSNGNVGIGTSSPNASSILDIRTTTKGVLFPRLTTAQINAITSPADGLMIYNTDLKTICFYDGGASVWKRVSHSNM